MSMAFYYINATMTMNHGLIGSRPSNSESRGEDGQERFDSTKRADRKDAGLLFAERVCCIVVKSRQSCLSGIVEVTIILKIGDSGQAGMTSQRGLLEIDRKLPVLPHSLMLKASFLILLRTATGSPFRVMMI